MTRRGRILLAIAALLTIAALILPLWTVRLVAPQYPEGLGLAIRTSTVVGLKPGDLLSINELNHYIGMRVIVPNAIPELAWMPKIVAFLAAILLIAAAFGSRRLAAAWCVLAVALAAAGIWDFHRWEYDYGHNLDMANAIIVIPGMSYQPPLLGSKQLLNFTATSWPASGTLALGGAMILVALAAADRKRTSRRPVPIVPAVPHLAGTPA
ncbi:MAG TPA: hypothetical protein VGM20_06230 [Gemmatimonadales bacterium]|jgi:hypothetical protein